MDTIGNIISKIQNSFNAKHSSVNISVNRKSNLVADQLVKVGLVKNKEIKDGIITLTFAEKLINLELKRISTPGRKIYISFKDLLTDTRKLGILVISTSKGVLLEDEAIKKRIGGQVLFRIRNNFKK